jgi:hypothetical protein
MGPKAFTQDIQRIPERIYTEIFFYYFQIGIHKRGVNSMDKYNHTVNKIIL